MQRPKGAVRPCHEAETPLAVENGVGKPAAPEKGAPNAGSGKREWRTPIPHLSLSDRKVGQGLIVFRGREGIMLMFILLLILKKGFLGVSYQMSKRLGKCLKNDE